MCMNWKNKYIYIEPIVRCVCIVPNLEKNPFYRDLPLKCDYSGASFSSCILAPSSLPSTNFTPSYNLISVCRVL